MTDVLILGGTGWLSGRVARAWTDAGASVTCLARGGRPAPEGAELIVADRAEPGAYDDVAAREWDEVVEISSIPEHVAAAVDALAERTRHWTYVSSLSVYATNDEVGADESAPLSEPARPGDEYDYSRAKAAAEASVRAALGDRAAIVRPGLIVGPGDPTDRFGYWVGAARARRRGGRPRSRPSRPHHAGDRCRRPRPTSSCGAARRAGTATANAIGDTMPLAELLAVAARDRRSHRRDRRGRRRRGSPATTSQHWMGPRSLPLWLPRDMVGLLDPLERRLPRRRRPAPRHPRDARAHARRRARAGPRPRTRIGPDARRGARAAGGAHALTAARMPPST